MKHEFLKHGFALNHVTFKASLIKAVLFLIHCRDEKQKKVYFSLISGSKHAEAYKRQKGMKG